MRPWDRFIQERLYLRNVSAETQRYYKCVESAFREILDEPTEANVTAEIIRLRQKGVSPISINTYLRGLKAYVRWRELPIKIRFQKTEQKILETLSDVQVRSLINFKPKGINQTRAHVLTLTILDTGLRASEALSLTRENVDFDNLVIHVRGKGGKHRLVPFSFELRKGLWRFSPKIPTSNRLLFGTKNKTIVTVRNFERDLKRIGMQCGITGVRFSPHTLRHTMAASWLRRGGDIYMLSRCLGHSSLSTTQVYLRSLGIVDIARVHAQVSLLSR